MTEEPRARAGGRRRHTTRRLLRHPSRAAKAESAGAADSVPVLIESEPAEPATVPLEQLDASRDQLSIVIEEVAEESSDAEPSTAKLNRDGEDAEHAADAKRKASGLDDTSTEREAEPRTASKPDAHTAEPSGASEPGAEAQTKPKIRFSATTTGRLNPSVSLPPQHHAIPPEPPHASITGSLAPMAPSPIGVAGALPRLSIPGAPSGEGIVRGIPGRSSPETDARARRDSELPTRPRIPLSQDMALVAGRITSQDISPYRPDRAEAGAARSHVSYAGIGNGDASSSEAPSVIVTRAHVISDPPPANDRAEGSAPRRNRRSRPDSEEFETLDLDDETTDEMARLDIPNPGERAGVSQEVSVRVSRTPPPPPAHNPNKRGLITGQHPTPSQRVAPPPPPPSAPPKRAPAAPSRKTTGRKRSWWEVLFSDDYIRTLPKVSHSAIQKQVNFMEASLGIKRGDSLLDIGCGLGHHAHEFARRGYLVVALDLALSMITRAAEEAQQRGLRINFLHKDIRDIGFEGTFDAVICVGTTFGFFDDEQNRGVLLRLAHALKPGGRLLLDVVNRDFVISTQPNLVWFEGEGCVVMEESDFNYYSSRLHVKRTMMRDDGRQSDVEYNLRLYSVHELGQLLKQCGFVIREVSGQEATRGLFFGAQSSRIVILAERRPFTRTQSGEEGAPPSGLEH